MIWNQRIVQLRAESGMTLKDIADQIGVSEATAQRYEKSIKNIPYDVIIKYSEIFDVSPSYIMGWSNKPGEPVSKDIMVKVTEEGQHDL